jgi:hypothetical protein
MIATSMRPASLWVEIKSSEDAGEDAPLEGERLRQVSRALAEVHVYTSACA